MTRKQERWEKAWIRSDYAPTKDKGPKPKRRKIEDKNYVDIQEIWGETSTTRQEKIKKSEDKNQRAAEIGIKDTKIPTHAAKTRNLSTAPQERTIQTRKITNKGV